VSVIIRMRLGPHVPSSPKATGPTVDIRSLGQVCIRLCRRLSFLTCVPQPLRAQRTTALKTPALQRQPEDQVESFRPPQSANSKDSSALTDDSFSLPSLTAANETSRLREQASEVCRSEACTVGTA
jgi:hypothetical protein